MLQGKRSVQLQSSMRYYTSHRQPPFCDTSVHDIKANHAKGPDAAVIDAIKLIQEHPSMSNKDIKAELRRMGHTKGSTAARALLKTTKI